MSSSEPIFYQDGFQKFLRLNSGRCVFVITLEVHLEYRYDTGERLILRRDEFGSNKEMWEAFKGVTPDSILSTLGSVLEIPPKYPHIEPLGLPH